MFIWRTICTVFKGLTNETSHKQLALGFAFGMLIGLVPKGNLTALLLMNGLLLLKVNLLTGVFSTLLFSFVGVVVDPLSHRIGLALLRSKTLEPLWTSLYDVPLVPWTRFNNTIVLGSLVLGVILTYPTYRLSKPLFARYVPRLQKLRIVQRFVGAEEDKKQGGE